jgi:hypothetical protein
MSGDRWAPEPPLVLAKQLGLAAPACAFARRRSCASPGAMAGSNGSSSRQAPRSGAMPCSCGRAAASPTALPPRSVAACAQATRSRPKSTGAPACRACTRPATLPPSTHARSARAACCGVVRASLGNETGNGDSMVPHIERGRRHPVGLPDMGEVLMGVVRRSDEGGHRTDSCGARGREEQRDDPLAAAALAARGLGAISRGRAKRLLPRRGRLPGAYGAGGRRGNAHARTIRSIRC